MFLTLNVLLKFDRTMPSYAQYRRIGSAVGSVTIDREQKLRIVMALAFSLLSKVL
jgi:hypothetical protein